MKKPKHEITPLPCGHFKGGSRVEVRNEQGAWFPAHVLDPNSNASPFSLRNRKPRLLVQYETLVSEEDPSKPLTEEVDVSLLRPAPPVEDNADEVEFTAHDVVDAFYMDAWWRGAVMSFDGEKYTVGFKSPPDLLELGRVDLRRHWDWCGGEWMRAEKERVMLLDFSPGDEVEVNLDKDRIWCAWIPANYVGPLGGNSFLIRYESGKNGDEKGVVKVVVSDYQIRPRPPQQEEGAFDLMSLVDAYHEMTWWVGDITKVLTGERFVVKFRYTKQEKEFSPSELRHHWEWTGTKWLTDTKELEEGIVNEEKLRYAKGSYKNSKEKTPWYTKSRIKQSTLFLDESPDGNPTKKLKLCRIPNDVSTFSSPTPSKKLKGKHSEDSLTLAALVSRATPANIYKRKGASKNGEKAEQQQVRQLDGEAISPVKKSRRRKSQVDSPSPSIRHSRKARSRKLHVKKSSGIEDEHILKDEHAINGIESSGIGSENEVMGGSHAGISCLLAMEDNQKRKEDGVNSGIKVNIKLPTLAAEHSKDPTAGSEDSVRDGLAVASVVKVHQNQDQSLSLFRKEGDSENTIEGSTSEKSEIGVKCSKADGVNSGIKVNIKLPTLAAEHSKDPTAGSEDSVKDGLTVASVVKVHQNHDQSLSLFRKEGDSENTIEGSTSEKNEVGVKCSMEQEDGPNLPFVKSIPLWETIESMDVFKKFPQKPHFLPLLKTMEVFREGSAFGKMLAFASLVDQTTKLRVDDPREVIDSNLEATVELELHGFDVNAIKHRLTELLDLKVKLEELHNRSKVIEAKILEWSQNTIKDTETINIIDKEIEDLEANIKALKEKRAMLVSMCSAKDSRASKLQSEAEVIKEGIQRTQCEFQKLAAAPL